MRNAPVVSPAAQPLPINPLAAAADIPAERDDGLVSILLTGTAESRALANCLRALSMQARALAYKCRAEVLIGDSKGNPALLPILAEAQHDVPAQLSLRVIPVDAQRPLDALRKAARGSRIVLLPVDAVPHRDWLRAGLAALSGAGAAAAYGIDDRDARTARPSSMFIMAEVLDAIAPGRFHALALQRSVVEWCGADALRPARDARTSRHIAMQGMPPRTTPKPVPARSLHLTWLATGAALGIALTAGLATLQPQARELLPGSHPTRLQVLPSPCIPDATQHCSLPRDHNLQETRYTPTATVRMTEI